MKRPKCGDLMVLKIKFGTDEILAINICKSCQLNIESKIKNFKKKEKIKLFFRI
jgi:hypothetical protein